MIEPNEGRRIVREYMHQSGSCIRMAVQIAKDAGIDSGEIIEMLVTANNRVYTVAGIVAAAIEKDEDQ